MKSYPERLKEFFQVKFLSLASVALTAGLAVQFTGPLRADDAQKTDQKVQQAVDPVCGMTVDKKTAQRAMYKGKTYYFCSRDDKQKFEKTPEKFTAKDQEKK